MIHHIPCGDCDDSNSELLSFQVDGDCDGVLTADDCDDEDPCTSNACGFTPDGGVGTCVFQFADADLDGVCDGGDGVPVNSRRLGPLARHRSDDGVRVAVERHRRVAMAWSRGRDDSR